MKRFTDSIRNALSNKDWYGALSTALTLPDVCGKLVSPESSSKARYIDWFNENMIDLYTRERDGHVFLHGEDCYALRCSYLHEGGSNIEEQRAQKALSDFHFITPLPGCLIYRNQVNSKLQLQVDVFCNEIADAVDKWYELVKDDEKVLTRMQSTLVIHDSSQGICF
ncbi:TPA: hypothetical protein KD045_003274 [Vibrio parahaemolyticus]|nr:hypothetical protein [Vibrio parahaemolyticus]